MRCSHRWVPERGWAAGGLERCELCRERFPCSRSCYHLDCVERAIELGTRPGFPKSFPHAVKVLAPGHDSSLDCAACGPLGDAADHWWLWVDPAYDPITWLLPDGWVLT